MSKATIRKVWLHTGTGQLHITIPVDIGIKKGDMVKITKIKL